MIRRMPEVTGGISNKFVQLALPENQLIGQGREQNEEKGKKLSVPSTLSNSDT